MRTRLYAPPEDLVRLTSDVPGIFELAGSLWEERSGPDPSRAAAIELEIRGSRNTDDFSEGAIRGGAGASGAPRGEAGADRSYSFEENLRWVHGATEFRCEVPGALAVAIDLVGAKIRAAFSPALFHSKEFSFLSRTLLEAPVAVLLARRGWQVLHAGAVVGPRGAVVLRGPSGAGKSTLVAAAHGAGLSVLGDESLLVSRTDADLLAATVREVTLREDAARLLGIFETTQPAFTGREEKRRVDLLAGARPEDRSARRLAAVLLGPREPGPARLTPLPRAEFLAAFRAGEIPQERAPGDPDAVARLWASRGALLLSGASDRAGAVRALSDLVR
jgi:hypothetical protein